MRKHALWIAAALCAFAAGGAPAGAQDSLTGHWLGSVTVNGMHCTFDRVMGADRTYGEIERCGPYVTSQRGTYRLFPNHVVGFEVVDWNPKRRYVVDAVPGTGHYEPNAKPPGGMFRYTFTGPDTMVWRDVNFGGTVTFHRAR